MEYRHVDSAINSLIEMCSNLRGLNFFEDYEGSFVEISILRAVGHRLHYLHLNTSDDTHVAALKNINFGNLQQLQSYHGSAPISAVLNTAINLEKIRLGDEPDLIVESLTKCSRLKYLELQRIRNVEGILDALERALFQTKKLRRNTLKIKISTDSTHWFAEHFLISNPQECIIKLNRVVNSLSVNKLDQWMIILDLHELSCEDPDEFIDRLGCSLTVNVAVIDVIQNTDNDIVLVTNPGCTICGWRESWLMSAK